MSGSSTDHRAETRLWAFVLTLSATVIVWWIDLAAATRITDAPIAIHGVILLVLFLVIEPLVIHVEFKGEAHAIDVSDGVVLLGLVCAAPLTVVVARVAAGLIAQSWIRVSPVKLVFNLALRALEIATVAVVYAGLLGAASPVSPRGWFAAYAGLVASQVLGSFVVTLVIALATGKLDVTPTFVLMLWAMAALNVSLGLLSLQVVWIDWRGLWMVAGALVFMFLGYRAFLTIRERYGNLGLLYRFTDTLAGATETEEVTEQTLSLARELLRADEALLVLTVPDGAIVRRMAADGSVRVTTHRGTGDDGAIVARLTNGDPILVAADERDDSLRLLAAFFGWSDLASAPLLGDHGVAGALVVGGRIGDVSTFEREDLRLLETFARNTTIALKVGELVAELKREAVEKEFQAMHDALTGLPNRAMLGERLDALLAETDNEHVAVLFMDLNGFKDVNDALGHHTGDVLLVEVGRRLQRTIGKRGILARLGGDEFAVITGAIGGIEHAVELARELCAAIQNAFYLDQLSLEISASVGVALAPVHATDSRTLFQRAEVAMYAAKDKRSGVEVYDEAHDHSSTRRLSLVGELRTALESDQLQLFYQPQTDLLTGTVISVEALARWPHPRFGFVAPDEFIPIAEQSGMIHMLTRWALRTAINDLVRWQARWPQLRMSVNMSTRNLLDPGFVADVAALLRGSGVAPEALTLELTESSVMADPQRSLVMLKQLHDLGVRLAIDDFGTGYSSLSYLKRLPVDEVKIDRSFVMNMAADPDDTVIVRSTIELAHNLGLHAVAEGVEDLETWNVLLRQGCDLAQGYFMSRPLSASALTEWFAERTQAVAGVRRLSVAGAEPAPDLTPVARYVAQAG